MKVLYDYQVFFLQKFGGISRYYYELNRSPFSEYFSHTAAKYHRNFYLEKMVASLPYPKNHLPYLRNGSYIGKKYLSGFFDKLFPPKNLTLENQAFVAKSVASIKPDIFHPTYYNDYFLYIIENIPFVLTIYDMTHEKFPEFYENDTETPSRKKKLFKLARQVIAISESTKRDIIDLYNDSGEKITVVHLANSIDYADVDEQPWNWLPTNYLLFIGGRDNYKNFLFFISSISKFLKKYKKLCVICIGSPFSRNEIKYLEFLDIREQVYQVFVNDDELSYLYRHATAFVFPSLNEGFGIPVLEAFACGCPVLASNSSSLPEVGGDAAIYFDPKSVSEIRNTVESVISDDSLRNRLIRKGYERVKHFSWEKTVKQTHDVYNKCI